MATFFNDYFGVDAQKLEDHGALNVSIINDLPLFIDPFLLFNSKKPEYQTLHREILSYMAFLRDKVVAGKVTPDLEKAWFLFPEVKQNWLGFSMVGNGGSGLGGKFASALRANLKELFTDFGAEKISRGSHIEKVCLLQNGVGRDMISDFIVNLVKHWLCRYTQDFAVAHIHPSRRRRFWVNKCRFDYGTQAWIREDYDLPCLDGDFVLLTPKDMLTKDENWINRPDMIHNFRDIPDAISDSELRGQVFNYFEEQLIRLAKDQAPSQREKDVAAARTIIKFPKLVDYYIKVKENDGDKATDISQQKVSLTRQALEINVKSLQRTLASESAFYQTGGGTYEEAHRRLGYLKDVIENKGGHRIFYVNGAGNPKEKELQILFRFVWFGSPSDVGTEANDGRGPVDYKISRGAKDKTLVEMKLARSTSLERNLLKQLSVYQSASDAENGIKVIIYFNEQEQARVEGILAKLGLSDHRDIVLIDARNDNKPSGSKAV